MLYKEYRVGTALVDHSLGIASSASDDAAMFKINKQRVCIGAQGNTRRGDDWRILKGDEGKIEYK